MNEYFGQPIALEFQVYRPHGYGAVCIAYFWTEEQALDYIAKRPNDFVREVEGKPYPDTCAKLTEHLYPKCEHGMLQSGCYGSTHWVSDYELAQGW